MPIKKNFFIFFESGLPSKGWFQACIVCELITSCTQLYKIIDNGYSKTNPKYSEINIITYLCHRCIKQKDLEVFNKTYCDICDELIVDNYIDIYNALNETDDNIAEQ